MKLAPLIQQLLKYLPKYSDKFGDEVEISAVAIAGTTVTITTGSAYTFSKNNVYISNVLEGETIIGSSFDSDTKELTCQTANDHGLTLAMNIKTKEKTPLTVDLVNNTDTNLNGEFPLLDVPNRNLFVLQLPDTVTTATPDGAVVNYASSRLSGLFNITPIDATNFSYEISSDASNVVPVTTSAMKANGNLRISGAANADRAIESYTLKTSKSNDTSKFWAFIVPGNQELNKSRNILNSAGAMINKNADPRLELLEEFDIIIFANTATQLSARKAWDEIQEVKLAIFKAFFGFPVIDQYNVNQQYLYIFTTANQLIYNSAYLAYSFTFQAQYDVTLSDMFTDYDYVPFRNINESLTFGNDEEMLVDINLDDNPGASV